MTRSLEKIVANHRAAASLRKAGKPIWSREIPIKDALGRILAAGKTPAAIVRESKGIAAMLRRAVPQDWLDGTNGEHSSWQIAEVMEYFDGVTEQDLNADIADGDDPVEQLDNILSDLYDWADQNRIWLGHSSDQSRRERYLDSERDVQRPRG